MPKVTKSSDGKGDAVVNTETGEETATFDDVLRPVFSPLGVAELTGKKAEYRKVGFANPHRRDDRSARASPNAAPAAAAFIARRLLSHPRLRRTVSTASPDAFSPLCHPRQP